MCRSNAFVCVLFLVLSVYYHAATLYVCAIFCLCFYFCEALSSLRSKAYVSKKYNYCVLSIIYYVLLLFNGVSATKYTKRFKLDMLTRWCKP